MPATNLTESPSRVPNTEAGEGATGATKDDCCFKTRRLDCGDEGRLQFGVNCWKVGSCWRGGKERLTSFIEDTGSVGVKEAEDKGRFSTLGSGGGKT